MRDVVEETVEVALGAAVGILLSVKVDGALVTIGLLLIVTVDGALVTIGLLLSVEVDGALVEFVGLTLDK